jgi:hypothetical protein
MSNVLNEEKKQQVIALGKLHDHPPEILVADFGRTSRSP